MLTHGRFERIDQANVFVGTKVPQYADMVARSKESTASPREWHWDDQGRGIWVNWWWLADWQDGGGRQRKV